MRGDVVSPFAGTVGIEQFSDRVQPHAAGWRSGSGTAAASLRSARWGRGAGPQPADQQRGQAEESDDFAEVQRAQVRAFRAHHPAGDGAARVSQGLVVVPTDSATPDQRRRYEEYAAARLPRTRSPQGPGRMLFAPDLVGTSEQITERLHAHAGFREVDEVAFALPFSFEHEDYVQILTDIATHLGPALGWRPGG